MLPYVLQNWRRNGFVLILHVFYHGPHVLLTWIPSKIYRVACIRRCMVQGDSKRLCKNWCLLSWRRGEIQALPCVWNLFCQCHIAVLTFCSPLDKSQPQILVCTCLSDVWICANFFGISVFFLFFQCSFLILVRFEAFRNADLYLYCYHGPPLYPVVTLSCSWIWFWGVC